MTNIFKSGICVKGCPKHGHKFTAENCKAPSKGTTKDCSDIKKFKYDTINFGDYCLPLSDKMLTK